ncbi:non-classical arabinogalactan protein 30-like [Henckelia pumila]|uniref:non-classical arabinogalactan protein 30-like n=1 Tax=Henckelia pumila TaxID=405737 RepID=UPI003C6E1754
MASPHFLNALLLLQFSLALANIPFPPSPPAPAPAPVPFDDPISLPPSPPPVEPPQSHPPFPRSFKVVIQGVVYCKSCKYIGVDTLTGASPLVGAVVKLRCPGYIKEAAKTDENGYFFFMPPKLTPFNSHKCKVFLVSSPKRTCNVATNLHDGDDGATPVPFSQIYNPSPLAIFNVGPFAFEPHKKLRCR